MLNYKSQQGGCMKEFYAELDSGEFLLKSKRKVFSEDYKQNRDNERIHKFMKEQYPKTL